MARKVRKSNKTEKTSKMIKQEMKFDYVYRGSTFEELSIKFDIPKDRIIKVADVEHWYALREVILENRENAWFRDIEADYIENNKTVNKQLYDTWQKILKLVDVMVEQGYYETGDLDNPVKKSLNPYTISTLSCIIEKAQAGLMTSNKMLTVQQEKLLEIQLKKIEQDEIQAPQGFSAKELFKVSDEVEVEINEVEDNEQTK